MSSATVRCRFPAQARRVSEQPEPLALVSPPRTNKRHAGRAACLLALAHHVERLIEDGELPSYAAAARALGLTRARLTQVLGLTLLSPSVQERVLTGELDMSERAFRPLAARAEWQSQVDALVMT